MAGFLLGAKLATVSVIVYLSIGLVGVPVFSAGGGPAYIFRPGFGFLLGFVLAAFVIGTITEKVGKNLRDVLNGISCGTGDLLYDWSNLLLLYK